MKTVVVLLLTFVVAFATSDDPTEFIIGGEDARMGQFPWMISIRIDSVGGAKPRHLCGGGILNRNWVITAAHCLLGGRESFVMAGTVRLQDEGDRYRIIRSIPHPQYQITNSNWHE
jgi:secreted trypsin-like serine protease